MLTPEGASTPTDIASLDRILALTDQVIGLQAELAEARYQNDLAELALNATGRSGRSSYQTEGDAGDLVLHARLSTETELRQALARQLAEAQARVAELERSQQAEGSSAPGRPTAPFARRAGRFARSTARAVWKRVR